MYTYSDTYNHISEHPVFINNLVLKNNYYTTAAFSFLFYLYVPDICLQSELHFNTGLSSSEDLLNFGTAYRKFQTVSTN